MSKPMTKNQIATIKANANGNETVLALLAEVERLQRLAKPNRKPKTRKARKSSYSSGGYIGQDGQTHSFPSYDDEAESYGKRIWGKEKVAGDGYPKYDPSRERY